MAYDQDLSGNIESVFYSMPDDQTPMMASQLKRALDMVIAKHGDVPVIFFGKVFESIDMIFPIRGVMGFRNAGNADEAMALLTECRIFDDPDYREPDIGDDGYPIADYEEGDDENGTD